MVTDTSTLSAELRSKATHALVDPALCPEALREGVLAGPQHRLDPPGVSTGNTDARMVLPFLVPLDASEARRSRIFRMLEAWALENHGVSWLASSLSVETLARRLGHRTDIMLSDSQPALLRLADARVLPVMHALMEPDERTRFFSPVSAWWYFDREERLRMISGDDCMDDDPWQAPWSLSDKQETGLLAAAEADTVLALLREQAWDKLAGVPPEKRHGYVVEQMGRAQGWGVESPAEQALFCLVSLHLGEDFSEGAKWRQVLERVKGKELTLEKAIAVAEGDRE